MKGSGFLHFVKKIVEVVWDCLSVRMVGAKLLFADCQGNLFVVKIVSGEFYLVKKGFPFSTHNAILLDLLIYFLEICRLFFRIHKITRKIMTK